jgi:hypothetical protein
MPAGSQGAKSLEGLLNADYVDELYVVDVSSWRLRMAEVAGGRPALRHMETYARFLSMSDSEINGTTSPVVQPETPLLGSRRVRKVTALSDFAPVNLKVRRYVMYLRPGAER